MSSSTSGPNRPTPPRGSTRLAAGIPAILLGFVTYILSNAFDSGFIHGLFQGATIALMVMGAYVLGAGTWFSRKNDEELRYGGHWLPSRDGRGEGTR